MKPRPLLYDESLDSCVPTETALPRNMTATAVWKTVIWGIEFDEFTVYQTTNETNEKN